MKNLFNRIPVSVYVLTWFVVLYIVAFVLS